MALNPRLTSFGVHQAVIKDLITFEMFPILILDTIEPDFSQDQVPLRGGSSAFPWASAPGEASGEIALTIKEYSKGVLEYFSPYKSGGVTEEATGEAAGNVGAITNVVGTSVVSADGIASIAAAPIVPGLKFGDYVVQAAAAATIDLYVNTDIGGETYVDETLKVTAAPVVIPGLGGTVESNGVEFTSGVAAAAMTPGDKASYSIRPINSYMLQHKVGQIGSAPKEFELTIAAEKVGDKIRVVRYPKCIASGGAGIKFPYKEWAQFETTVQMIMDPTVDYVAIQTFINR